MPGQPKRTINRLRELLKSHGIDPDGNGASGVEMLEGPGLNTHVSTRTRAQEPPAPSPLPLGPQTRRMVDASEAQRQAGLQEMIIPNTPVRIERTRPTWAAGWLEDFDLEDGEGYADMLQYIADEHGGQSYRISALSSDKRHVLATGRVAIAGPVKVGGKPKTREQWEGRQERVQQPVATPLHNPSPAAADNTLAIVQLLMTSNQTAQQAQLESMERIAEVQANAATEIARRQPAANGGSATAQPSFGESLRGIIDTANQLDEVRDALTPSSRANEPPADAAGQEKSLIRKATEELFLEGMRAEISKRAPAPAAQQQPQPQQQLRRVVQRQPQPQQPQQQQQRVTRQVKASPGVTPLQ